MDLRGGGVLQRRDCLILLLTAVLLSSCVVSLHSWRLRQHRGGSALQRPVAAHRPLVVKAGVGPGFGRDLALRQVTGPVISLSSLQRPGSPPRRLVVVPQCGFGNRLLVLSRAHDLARRLEGAEVYFNWYPAKNINLTVDKAFNISTLPPSFELNSLRQRADLGIYGSCLPAQHCKQKIRNLFPYAPRRFSRPRYWLQTQGGRPAGYARHEVSVLVECRNGGFGLYTTRENHPNFSVALHDLSPSPAIARTVRQVELGLGLGPPGGIGGAGSRRVGIQYRGSDKLNCFTEQRREELWRIFVGLVQREISLITQETVLFLTTDDSDAASRLRSELPASVAIRTRNDIDRSRESEAGMLDAVVDWFLLAGSRSIIGNVQSTFAYTAAVRNGIRYTVAYEKVRLCNM